MDLDTTNKNREWDASVDVEMDKIKEMQSFIDHGKKDPPKGYKKITTHNIFDVKYDGRKRARLVGGGHLTEAPDDVSFSGIALLKIVRVIISIAILNGLEICACDIGSGYLEAFTKEKLYTIAGPEFKELAGHI